MPALIFAIRLAIGHEILMKASRVTIDAGRKVERQDRACVLVEKFGCKVVRLQFRDGLVKYHIQLTYLGFRLVGGDCGSTSIMTSPIGHLGADPAPRRREALSSQCTW